MNSAEARLLRAGSWSPPGNVHVASPRPSQSKSGPTSSLSSAMNPSRETAATPMIVLPMISPFASSALDAVVHVGDAALSLEDPGALEGDLLGREPVEQTSSLAEKHRDDMKLDLVEDAGAECELCDSGTVHQHVLVPRGLFGLRHRTRDAADVGHERPLRDVDAGLVSSDDEDRHAVVVVTAPAAGRLEGPPASDDRAGGHELVNDLAVDAARTAHGLEIDIAARHEPLVQAVPAVAEPVARSLVGAGDEPVEGHRHVENGRGHGVSFRSSRNSTPGSR